MATACGSRTTTAGSWMFGTIAWAPVSYLEAVLRLCTRHQLRQLLARVEHARLDRALRNANDLGYLFD
jgi:hypothetical protein